MHDQPEAPAPAGQIDVFKPGAFDGAILASRRLPYIYVQNWKCGCSTIKSTLWAAEHAVGTAVAPGHPHQRIADYPFINDPGRWEGAGREFVFTFVRNPFARMLSAYLNKIVLHRDPSVWGRFAARHGLGEEALPFGEFLELVARTPPAQMDMHWRPQSHTVAPHAVAYDFVGSMERFEEDLGQVLTRIFGRDLPVHEHAPHRTGSTDQLADHYGAEEIDLVRRICAVDFRELGYSTDPARQMREPRPGAIRPDAMQAWGSAWRLFAQQEFAAAATTLEPTTQTLTGPVAADRLLRCHLALLARGGPVAVPESRKHVSEALESGLGAAETWKAHGQAMLTAGRVEEGLTALLQAARMRNPSKSNRRRIERLRRRLALLRAREGRRTEAMAILAPAAPPAGSGPILRLRAAMVAASHRAMVSVVAAGAAVMGRADRAVAHESRP
jgi:Sulfotransferase family